MDLRSIISRIQDLETETTITEATKETGSGRVHRGSYGTSYQPDEKRDEYGHRMKGTKAGPDIDGDEEKDDKPAKRGRGRPTKAGSSADTAAKYSGAQELQRWIVGSVPKKSKELDKLPSKKHKLKDWIEHVEAEMIAESEQGVAEGLTEMDKSQPSHGRDGRVSHSTYGSRDKQSNAGGKEHTAKAVTAKQAKKDALDTLKKQGVAEAAPITIKPATQKQTQVVQQGNDVIAQVDNPTLAAQIKQAVGKGEMKFDSENKLEEKKMTAANRAKEKRLKAKYDDSGMKASMKKQYGDKKGKDIYFATIRKQAMSEGKQLNESVLDEILQRFPHEHKQCQEGWGMDESLYEALCDHYFKEGRIPHKVWHGPLEELRQCVEACYAEDTMPVMEDPYMDENVDQDPSYTDALEPFKQAVAQKYPDVKGMKYIDKPDIPGQISAEVPGKDRSYGVFDRNTGTGEVLDEISSLERTVRGIDHSDEAMSEEEHGEMEMNESKFSKLSGKLAKKPGVKDPDALAAWIGREKYGKAGMAKKSAEGRKKANESISESQDYKAWASQLETLLAEGLTVTTSTGNKGMDGYGAEDSVSVSATGSDAKEIMELLRNAGIGVGGKMDSTDSMDDHDHDEEIMVSDPDSVMGTLSDTETDDAGDTTLSFIKKMMGVPSDAADDDYASEKPDEDDKEESSDKDEDDKEELDEGAMKQKMHSDAEQMTLKEFCKKYGNEDWVKEFYRNTVGEDDDAEDDDDDHDHKDKEKKLDEEGVDEDAFSYAAAQAAKRGEKEFEFGGKKHPVTINKKTAQSIDEEARDDPATMEQRETCHECGSYMEEGHACEDKEKIDEWANNPQDPEKQDFQVEMDYMLKLLSGGLNGPKKDQTVMPKTQTVPVAESDSLTEWRRLAGIK